MEHVDILLLKEDLARVTDLLYRSRMIETTVSQGQNVERVGRGDGSLLSRITVMTSFLEEHHIDRRRGLDRFFPAAPARANVDPGGIRSSASSWLDEVERSVLTQKKGLSQAEEDIQYINETRQKLIKLSGLKVQPGKMDRLRRTVVMLGLTRDYRDLRSSIEEMGGIVEGSLLNRKEGLHSVKVIYLASQDRDISPILRGRLFTPVNIDMGELSRIARRYGAKENLTGMDIIQLLRFTDGLENDIRGSVERLEGSVSEVSDEQLARGLALKEALEIEMEKEAHRSGYPRTVYTGRVSGWVEKRRMGELRSSLKELVGESFHISRRDPTDDEVEGGSVPSKLVNNRLGKLFEGFTLTFATPRYNEIDPSIWISIPFIIFFGLMLGDIGYGLMITAASFLILKKGSSSPFLRTVGRMGVLMGGATVLAGIWMGALFGDLFPRFFGEPGSPLFRVDIFGLSLPYDALKDPMLLFQLSLWLGLAQLNIGLILLGYDSYKKGDWFSIFKGTISWFLIQVGAIIFVGAIIIGWFELTTTLALVGGITFFGGSLLLAFKDKGMTFFSIEGYMGDLISYTRILALGLSTFGLAMAFNIVAGMVADISWLFAPVVLVMLVVLHVFNLLLQTLGSTVHSLRLQFVEFFGRFYEGGGRLFQPMGRERTYTVEPKSSGSGGGMR